MTKLITKDTEQMHQKCHQTEQKQIKPNNNRKNAK
jgi:hypothetical protein